VVNLDRYISEAISTGKHKARYGSVYSDFFTDTDKILPSDFKVYLAYLGYPELDRTCSIDKKGTLRKKLIGYSVTGIHKIENIDIFNKDGKTVYAMCFTNNRLSAIIEYNLNNGYFFKDILPKTEYNLEKLASWIESAKDIRDVSEASDDQLGLNEAISTGKHRRRYTEFPEDRTDKDGIVEWLEQNGYTQKHYHDAHDIIDHNEKAYQLGIYTSHPETHWICIFDTTDMFLIRTCSDADLIKYKDSACTRVRDAYKYGSNNLHDLDWEHPSFEEIRELIENG
jgi:hypothetical protein